MDLLSTTLNGIGQVGDTLDKYTGGRAVRGALAGKPRELASIVPFSDTMGLTNEADKTSGRDLTDHYGITNKGSNSFGSHAAGFLADNVLSPANWLGAGAAFKVAPTIAKGITSGAKALTGLDLVDHIAGGAKSLGKFIGGDAGTAAYSGRNLPLPVNTDYMNETAKASNASRPRRYSEDPAKSAWYAGDRAARFGAHFGSGPGNTAVPSGIPEFNLNDAIRGFVKDDSGSLNLGAFGARQPADMSALAPAKAKINQAIGDAANGFTGRYPTDTPYGPANELARRFIKAPQLPSDPAEALKVANGFQKTIASGASGADQYSGTTYHSINRHLRELGPEGAQAEIDAIRSGRTAGAPSVRPPGEFSPSELHTMDEWDKLMPQQPASGAPNPNDVFSLSDVDFAPAPYEAMISEANKAKEGMEYKGGPPQPPAAKPSFTPPGWVPPFYPDPAKVEAFKAANKTLDPYEALTNQVNPPENWNALMDNHFGAESPHYKSFYQNQASIIDNAINGTGALGAPASQFKPDMYKFANYGFNGDPDKVKELFEMAAGSPTTESLLKNKLGDEFDAYKNHFLGEAGAFGDTGFPSGSHTGLPVPSAGQSSLDPPAVSEIRPIISNLMDLFEHSRTPEQMNLYRGVNRNGRGLIEKSLGVPLGSPEAVGKEFIDPAFLSTSHDHHIANGFAGINPNSARGVPPDSGVTFHFPEVPAGKPAAFMNASEGEVLFPPGRRIRIDDNSRYPNIQATLYGTLLAALMGRQMHGQGQEQPNGNP